MSYDVLNVEKEIGLCCVATKRNWEIISGLIEETAQEQNLSKKEKEALYQRTAASVRYKEMVAENEYLSRSEDKFSKRRIAKNKLEMQRMKKVAEKNIELTKKSGTVLNEKMQRAFQNQQSQQSTNKSTQKK